MAHYTFLVKGMPHTVKGESIKELVDKAFTLYQVHGVDRPLKEIKADALQQVALATAKKKSVRNVKAVAVKQGESPSLSLNDLFQAGKALFKNMSGLTVSQQELNRRGQICKRCPMRIESNNCKKCGIAGQVASLFNTAKAFFGGKTLSMPNTYKEQGCGICGCSFSLLLPARKEDLHQDSPAQHEKRVLNAPFCWLLDNDNE